MTTAISRRNGQGSVVGANERATGAEALHMFTDWAAYGGFEEGRKGTIRRGALADLVLLTGDPTASEPDLSAPEVETTFLGGEIVYSRRA